jgi:O-antigen/teichoic acid export membrane protein
MIVAIFAIPLLIKQLGTDRFGVLVLVWMVVGYFSLFDMGLGRALTQLVSENLGVGKDHVLPVLVWTALFIMLLLGFAGTIILYFLSPLVVLKVLNIPDAIQNETLHAFYFLAISIPLVISSSGLSGILEAHQRFGLINAVRLPLGMFTFIGPLLVLPFFNDLFSVVVVLVVGRFVAWLFYLRFCLQVLPDLRKQISLQRSFIKPLLRFGSWITMTNIVSPLLPFLDRFLISAMISVKALAYYSTPYEVVTRLKFFPVALVGVLFPFFASSFGQERNRAAQIYDRGVKYTFLVLFPVILLIVTFSYDILNVWLGREFADQSAVVLQILAIGVFINSLARIPYALLQGIGRPDLTFKLYLIELPPYLLAIYWLINAYGIEGAAVAWLIRMIIEMIFLFFMAQRLFSNSIVSFRLTASKIAIALLALILAILPVGLVMKSIFLSLTLFLFSMISWFIILTPDERILVQSRMKIFSFFR